MRIAFILLSFTTQLNAQASNAKTKPLPIISTQPHFEEQGAFNSVELAAIKKPEAEKNEAELTDGTTSDTKIYLKDPQWGLIPTTLVPEIQNSLASFLETRGNQIAALAVVDVANGHILGLVQGKDPAEWQSQEHTGLHVNFPAASIFKTVSAAAAIEEAKLGLDDELPLPATCSNVPATSDWWQDAISPKRIFKLTLRAAFGDSCNSYFAKLSINQLGLKLIIEYARRFHWGERVPTDFQLEPSPMEIPNLLATSSQNAGRFAAGFGNVGMSAIHAAWIFTGLARDGKAIPLRLFDEDFTRAKNFALEPTEFSLVKPDTAAKMRELMKATVEIGTASNAFRRGKFRELKSQVGGKTGTLTGYNPFGLTTWFAGMMPIDQPKVVVISVVVLNQDHWVIKATQAAAEAFAVYQNLETKTALKGFTKKADNQSQNRHDKVKRRPLALHL